jgi:hypothetical protein
MYFFMSLSNPDAIPSQDYFALRPGWAASTPRESMATAIAPAFGHPKPVQTKGKNVYGLLSEPLRSRGLAFTWRLGSRILAET